VRGSDHGGRVEQLCREPAGSGEVSSGFEQEDRS
jgi:hypothetical protein